MKYIRITCINNNKMNIPVPSSTIITVYSRPFCPNCEKCKVFLKDKHISFTEVMLDVDDASYIINRDFLIEKTGNKHKTYPFVFVGDAFLGGYNEIVNAYATLKLHDLCAKAGITIDHDF